MNIPDPKNLSLESLLGARKPSKKQWKHRDWLKKKILATRRKDAWKARAPYPDA